MKFLAGASLKTRILLSFLALLVVSAVGSGSAVSLFFGAERNADEYMQERLFTAKRLFSGAEREVGERVAAGASRLQAESDDGREAAARLPERVRGLKDGAALDLLRFVDASQLPPQGGPPVGPVPSPSLLQLLGKVGREKRGEAGTVILSLAELEPEGEALLRRVSPRSLSPQPPPADAAPAEGLFLMAAAPVLDRRGALKGILYGGRLIDQDDDLVRTIGERLFGTPSLEAGDSVVTIFRRSRRISTTLKPEHEVRFLGTAIPEEIGRAVLANRQPIKRMFVVDDWYISAYEPLYDVAGDTLGILGIGVREEHFTALRRRAIGFLAATLVLIAGCSLGLSYLLTASIMRPVRALLRATDDLARGRLEPLAAGFGTPYEIAELEKAFNAMARSVASRDERIRQFAQAEIMKSERLAMVGRLSAGVAHEINNPLGGILLFSHLLLQKTPPESPLRENMERIERDAKRCQNIVQGLLDFSRQREPGTEKVLIRELLDKTLDLFKNQTMFHNIAIEKRYHEDRRVVAIDPAQMQQVFVNLIVNAVDAMNRKGTLTLRTAPGPHDDTVEIAFADTGSGIDPAAMDRIFEPFFTTKGVGQGTGLGLSVSLGIVQRHGGTITVTSEVGKGAVFTVSLPLVKELA